MNPATSFLDRIDFFAPLKLTSMLETTPELELLDQGGTTRGAALLEQKVRLDTPPDVTLAEAEKIPPFGPAAGLSSNQSLPVIVHSSNRVWPPPANRRVFLMQ